MSIESECVLCNAINDIESNIENTKILESNNYVMMPGLGDFIGGYSLIVSKNHIHSSAYIEDDELHRELDKFLNLCETFLFRNLGKSVISAEHGSVLFSVNKGPACVNHLHIHLFPADINKENVLVLLGNYKTIKSLSDLRQFYEKNAPYVLLKFPDGEIVVKDAVNIKKQFARTVISKLIGKEDEWNWVIHENLSNIKKFLKLIGIRNENI